MSRRQQVLTACFALLVAYVASVAACSRADASMLGALGYDEARDGGLHTFISARVRDGMTPGEVSAAMPTTPRVGQTVERYIVTPSNGGPEWLLERYVYRRGLGRWRVQIYYSRGGGVYDIYATDDAPGLGGARRVSAAAAERWRAGPPGKELQPNPSGP